MVLLSIHQILPIHLAVSQTYSHRNNRGRRDCPCANDLQMGRPLRLDKPEKASPNTPVLEQC